MSGINVSTRSAARARGRHPGLFEQPTANGVSEQRRRRRQATAHRSTVHSLALRGLRFAGVGGLCGLIQLVLLFALTRTGLNAVPANVLAYLLSAQANFVLSDRFIWGDRRLGQAAATLTGRWLAFHLSIAGTFLLSQAVFIVGRAALPDLVSSALGIGISALANFAIQDRFTFRGGAGGTA